MVVQKWDCVILAFKELYKALTFKNTAECTQCHHSYWWAAPNQRIAKSISNLRNPGEHSTCLFRLQLSEEPGGNYLTVKEVSSVPGLSSIPASNWQATGLRITAQESCTWEREALLWECNWGTAEYSCSPACCLWSLAQVLWARGNTLGYFSAWLTICNRLQLY